MGRKGRPEPKVKRGKHFGAKPVKGEGTTCSTDLCNEFRGRDTLGGGVQGGLQLGNRDVPAAHHEGDFLPLQTLP